MIRTFNFVVVGLIASLMLSFKPEIVCLDNPEVALVAEIPSEESSTQDIQVIEDEVVVEEVEVIEQVEVQEPENEVVEEAVIEEAEQAVEEAAEEPVVENKLDLGKVKVGDIVKLGTCEQDNKTKNGEEDIEWQIISINDEEIRLVSVHIIDKITHDTEEETFKKYEEKIGDYTNIKISLISSSLFESTSKEYMYYATPTKYTTAVFKAINKGYEQLLGGTSVDGYRTNKFVLTDKFVTSGRLGLSGDPYYNYSEYTYNYYINHAGYSLGFRPMLTITR